MGSAKDRIAEIADEKGISFEEAMEIQADIDADRADHLMDMEKDQQ